MIVLGVLLGSCLRSNSGEPKWHKLDAGPYVFSAPEDVVERPLKGRPEDSYVKEYTGEAVDIMIDYGLYSSSLRDYEMAHSESIDGRAARLVQYDAAPNGEFRFTHFRAAYFATTAERKKRLTMYVSCRDAQACRDAEAMFRTVRFR